MVRDSFRVREKFSIKLGLAHLIELGFGLRFGFG
jgi:hypothetical protein